MILGTILLHLDMMSVQFGDNSIAIGNQSEANAVGSIQLGQGNNTVANSLNVWDYQLVRSDGKIPQERIIERFFEYQLTIQPQNWINNSYSANIADMTADALVWVSPDASSFDDYGKKWNQSCFSSPKYINFCMY